MLFMLYYNKRERKKVKEQYTFIYYNLLALWLILGDCHISNDLHISKYL